MPVICGTHRKITSWFSSENLFVLKFEAVHLLIALCPRSMDVKPKYSLPIFKLFDYVESL